MWQTGDMTSSVAMPWWLRSLVAIVGGVLLAFSFAPVGAAWCAPFGITCFTVAAWQARLRVAFVAGSLGGFAFFLPLLAWMSVIGTDAWIALSVFCAMWFGLMQMAVAGFTRLRWAPLWVGCAWVLQEALRGRIPWGGFPWGDLAFTAPNTPWDATLSWLGSAGTSFLLAVVGACLAQAIVALRVGARRTFVASGAVALAIGLLASLAPLAQVTETGSMRIAVIQGGTPQWGMGAMDVRRAVLDNHVEQTLLLADAIGRGTVAAPDLVLWPENASDIDPFEDASAAAAITAATRAVGVPVLVGAVITAQSDSGEPLDGAWNVGLLWGSGGVPEQMYIKTHPVPFGEFIHFRARLTSLIGRLDRTPRDVLPGSKPGVFTVGAVVVGDVICFEIAYQDVVAGVVDEGAEIITVQTNNATYGGTAQPEQQLDISRARAIEQGRTVVVAATSGISAFIQPDGTVSDVMSEGEVGYRVNDVTLFDGLTPGHRIGPYLEILLCVGALGALVAVVFLRRRRSTDTRGATLPASPPAERPLS